MSSQEQATALDPSVTGARSGRAPRWNGRQISVLIVLLMVVTSNYADRAILGILQDPVKADLKLSDWQLGLLSGPAFAIFYALSGLPSARLAERMNRSTLLSVIVAIWSGMTALCGAAQNFIMLALFRAGVGMGEGGCIPISHSLVSDHFSARQRGMAMAVLACGSPLGGILAAMGGAWIADTWGWRVAFLALGVPGICLAFIVRMVVKDPRRAAASAAAAAAEPAKPSTLKADIGWLLRSRTFVLLFAASAVNALANSAVTIFTASYFLRTYDLSLAQVGAIFAVGVGVAGLGGTLASGALADRFAGERGRSYALIPAIGAGLAGIFFLIAFTRDLWWMSLIVLVAANFATDMKTPSLAAVQNISPPYMRATSASVLFLAITVCGTGLGPPLAGIVSDIVASNVFSHPSLTFAAACPGGHAAAGLEALNGACRSASADGIRGGLMAGASLFFVSMTLFYLASRTIRLTLDQDPAPAASDGH